MRILSCFFLSTICCVLCTTLFAQEQPSVSDDVLLEKIQHSSFQYFANETNFHNGLVRDRSSNREGAVSNAPASIAAVGFALTAYPVAVERGWMARGTAQELTKRTLKFFLLHAPQHKGFFYHFLDFESGKRYARSELSPIDTALFLAGALFAAEYYDDPQIRELVNKIYARVDFPWLLNKGKTFALAWSPETGFSRQRWDHYDESLLLYVLAIGSPAHPVPPETWKAVLKPIGSYREYRLIRMPPLFTHQFPQVWLDLKDKNDGFADYFKNSTNATLANIDFCMDQASQFKDYGPDFWGLSASDGPFGYKAYGAPPGWSASADGTIAPTACGSSIVFTPEASIACLRNLDENYSDQMWGRYGFSDAINPTRNWVSEKVFGIDQGPLLLMIENYRSGLIWKLMSRSRPVQEGLRKMGFQEGTIELPWVEPPEYRAPFLPGGLELDGLLRDWPHTDTISLTPEENLEFGSFSGPADSSAKIRFAWDEKYFYFVAKIRDDSVRIKRAGKNIWRDDLLEIYIDPEGDGFVWESMADFQLGFRPASEERDLEIWSWFQGGESFVESQKAAAQSYVDAEGYILEGAIRWDVLEIQPQPGLEVSVSVGLHDIDPREGDGKLVWFFREQGFQQFELGKVILAPSQD